MITRFDRTNHSDRASCCAGILDHILKALRRNREENFIIIPACHCVCEQTWVDGRKYFDRDEDKALNAEIARIVETDEVKKAFAATGLDLAVGPADEFEAYIRSEYVKWEKVAKVAKIVTD